MLGNSVATIVIAIAAMVGVVIASRGRIQRAIKTLLEPLTGDYNRFMGHDTY